MFNNYFKIAYKSSITAILSILVLFSINSLAHEVEYEEVEEVLDVNYEQLANEAENNAESYRQAAEVNRLNILRAEKRSELYRQEVTDDQFYHDLPRDPRERSKYFQHLLAIAELSIESLRLSAALNEIKATEAKTLAELYRVNLKQVKLYRANLKQVEPQNGEGE